MQEARSVRLMEKGRMKGLEDSKRFVEDMEVLGELVPPNNFREVIYTRLRKCKIS